MNDPHVQILFYELVHNNSVSYANAPSLEFDTTQFRVSIDFFLAQFEMKDHFATVEEARHKIDEFVEEWQSQADADPNHGPGEFRLEFKDAEIVDRDPSRSATYKWTASDAELTVVRATFPEPPASWPQTVVTGQNVERDEALPITPAGAANGVTGSGAQQLPSLNQEAHGLEPNPTQPELDAARQAALDALEALKQALAQEKGTPTIDQEETPGIGHNKPPESLIELDQVVDVGVEAVTEPKPEIGTVQTVRAALQHYANIFGENLSAAAGKSVGAVLGPALLGALFHAIGLLDKLVEILKAYPG